MQYNVSIFCRCSNNRCPCKQGEKSTHDGNGNGCNPIIEKTNTGKQKKTTFITEDSKLSLIHTKSFLGSSQGGGGYRTCGWMLSASRQSQRYPLLIFRNLLSYPLLCCILAENGPFWLFFANCWIIHPYLWKIYRKRDTCLEKFSVQKPTHVGGTYPYPQHVIYHSGGS